MTPTAVPDFEQSTVRELHIQLQTGGSGDIFLDPSGDDLTAESAYVTLVDMVNNSGFGAFQWNHHFNALAKKKQTTNKPQHDQNNSAACEI